MHASKLDEAVGAGVTEGFGVAVGFTVGFGVFTPAQGPTERLTH
jgi:hypothetical protein